MRGRVHGDFVDGANVSPTIADLAQRDLASVEVDESKTHGGRDSARLSDGTDKLLLLHSDGRGASSGTSCGRSTGSGTPSASPTCARPP